MCIPEELLESIVPEDGKCWLVDSIGVGNRAYEYFFGPLPTNVEVIRTCKNARCVHPDHMLIGKATDWLKPKKELQIMKAREHMIHVAMKANPFHSIVRVASEWLNSNYGGIQ